MKTGSLVIAAMSLAFLAGCSTKSAGYAEANVSTLISAVSLIEGQKETIVRVGPHAVAVAGTLPLSAPVHVRVCNTDMSTCNLGVGKVNTTVTILALSKGQATVKVDVQWKLDRTMTAGNKANNSLYTLDNDVPALRGNYSKSGTITVDYNHIGRVDLPYGSAFKLCIEAPSNGSTDAPLGCQGPEVLYPL